MSTREVHQGADGVGSVFLAARGPYGLNNVQKWGLGGEGEVREG